MENFKKPTQSRNGQNIRLIKDSPHSSNHYRAPRGDKCIHCSKQGHTSNQCLERKRQTVNLVTYAEKNEEPEDEPYKNNKDIEEDKEWTHLDEGLLLVI